MPAIQKPQSDKDITRPSKTNLPKQEKQKTKLLLLRM